MLFYKSEVPLATNGRRRPLEAFLDIVTEKSERYKLSHIFMLLIISLYTLIGGLAFCALESQHEMATIRRNIETRVITKEIARTKFVNEVQEVLDKYDQLMAYQPQANHHGDKNEIPYDQPRWDLWTGLYYSATLYTTIGYGDIAPQTTYGKIFTVVYAFIGIPIVITVLNIWGGGLFEIMQSLWANYVERLIRFVKTHVHHPDAKRRRPARIDSLNEDYNSLEDSEAALGLLRADDATVELEKPAVPLKLAFFALILWMSLFALLFSKLENWDFFSSLYFCSISLTTIGLGDITIPHHERAILYFFLILVGLAVVSMAINIIQLHIEFVFAKILRSIDNDFKSLLNEEKRKMSMSTSMYETVVSRKNTATVLSIPVPSLEEQEEYRRRSLMGDELTKLSTQEDAVRRYAKSMPFMDKLLVNLMSSHQKKLLNQRVAEKSKMRNQATQTDAKKTSTGQQTEYIKTIENFIPIRNSLISESTESSSDSEDNVRPSAQVASSSNATHHTAAGVRNIAQPQRGQRKKGLSRKKLYIYNIGD